MSDDAFPACLGDTIEVYLGALDSGYTILRRPLRPMDPNGAIGVYESDWAPVEIDIGPTADPGIAQYNVIIQTLVKNTDESFARNLSSKLAKTIRRMLYGNATLRLALWSLSETMFGATESVVNLGVQRQRFAQNSLNGEFVCMSVTELFIQTQSN